jgi:hypothetical protein
MAGTEGGENVCVGAVGAAAIIMGDEKDGGCPNGVVAPGIVPPAGSAPRLTAARISCGDRVDAAAGVTSPSPNEGEGVGAVKDASAVGGVGETGRDGTDGMLPSGARPIAGPSGAAYGALSMFASRMAVWMLCGVGATGTDGISLYFDGGACMASGREATA